MNYKFMLAAAICTLSTVYISLAQQNKEVEVTKAYIPKIEPASKMTLIPDMSDTVRIEPDIDYTVTPLSIATSLATTPFKPASVTYWEFNRPKQYYAKIGAGYPLNSVVDIYASTHNSSVGYLIGYVNHDGRYSKISNDFNQKNNSQQIHSTVGVAAGTYIGKKTLEGELKYNNDLWSRYATSGGQDGYPLYQDFGLDIHFGDTFSDMSRWNFALDGNIDYFCSRSDYSNTYLGAMAKLARGVGENGWARLNIGYDYVGADVNYDNNSFILGGAYGLVLSNVEINIGGTYIYDGIESSISKSSKSYFLPELKVQIGRSGAVIPFIEIVSDIQRNNYGALTDINPYILAATFAPLSSVDYSFIGGLKGGDKGGKVLYKLYFDYTYGQNSLYWRYNVYTNLSTLGMDNYYTVNQASLQSCNVAVDLRYRPITNFTITASGAFHSYNRDDNISLEVGRPEFEAGLNLEYILRDWNLRVGSELISEREWSVTSDVVSSGVYTAPTTVNLTAAADYKLNKNCFIFLEGDNLACANIYNWAGYREYGISFTAGVKLQF